MPDAIVGLVDRRGYDEAAVEAAAREAVRVAFGPEALKAFKSATVLLKPNILLASAPERAATTHPAVVRAAIRIARDAGARRVLVGDSPGWQPTGMAAAKAGIAELARAEGAELADFSQGVEVELPEGSLIKRFELARPVVEAELLVNLPKLKTHGLMYYTGAVKNLFGCIPGLKKSAFHLRFPGRKEFAAMLADLYLAVKPGVCLMDAVVGMEGPGPNNGRPREIGLIMASRSGFALDWVAAGLIGYAPRDIPYLAHAADDPRYGFDPAEIRTVGEDPQARVIRDFERVRVLKDNDIFKKHLPAWAHRLIKNLSVARPFFSAERCVRCSACVKICPARCLGLEPGARAPAVDYGACIRCYCCHEVCPADAIELRRRPCAPGPRTPPRSS